MMMMMISCLLMHQHREHVCVCVLGVWGGIHVLALKAPITTAADNILSFFVFFSSFFFPEKVSPDISCELSAKYKMLRYLLYCGYL